MFGFLFAVRINGNFAYFGGAAVAGALAVTGHVVVYLAFERIKRVLSKMLYDVEVKINESVAEMEEAEQAVQLAESDLANKN